MNVVRCNACGVIAREEDFMFDEAKREESCPNCMEWEGLQDLDSECSFRNYELIDLYRLFQVVPGCQSGCIVEYFMDFPTGTPGVGSGAWVVESFGGGMA